MKKIILLLFMFMVGCEQSQVDIVNNKLDIVKLDIEKCIALDDGTVSDAPFYKIDETGAEVEATLEDAEYCYYYFETEEEAEKWS